MKLKYPLINILLILCVFGCRQKAENKLSEVENLIYFQEVLDSIYAPNNNAVGIMVHVEAPEKHISWSGASGISNKQTKAVLQKNQPVLIASNTKTYVAVSILRLIEDKLLKLNDPILELISPSSRVLLENSGYSPGNITVENLLTHTSGIFDYAQSNVFFESIGKTPNRRWTRDEQIELAMTAGKPLGEPNEVFSYSDTNYLLLSEIIETLTQKDFYFAIRELLDFDGLLLNTTWFSTLEKYPENTQPLAYQYSGAESIDSYGLDHSFDLYGGGGLASTTKELAVFLHGVFNNKVFKNPKTLDLIFTGAKPKQPMQGDYFLGLTSVTLNEINGYGHEGYWGTMVNHFPELNATIAVCVLERDKKGLMYDLTAAYIEILKGI